MIVKYRPVNLLVSGDVTPLSGTMEILAVHGSALFDGNLIIHGFASWGINASLFNVVVFGSHFGRTSYTK